MPQCGCFHHYELSRTGPKDYELKALVEGQLDLRGILEKAGVAQSVSANPEWFSETFKLTNVSDEAELRSFLDLLRSRVVIDLAPELNESHALAPFSVAEEEAGPITGRSRIGELVNRAKYHSDRVAIEQLRQQMANFAARHPRYNKARFIVAVPPSSPGSADLPRQFLDAFTDRTVVQVSKTRYTQPQKDLLAARDESALRANISNSVRVNDSLTGAAVIVVDDICGSGETLKEVARACRSASAGEVLGLVAAKDATLLQGGVSLLREHWQ